MAAVYLLSEDDFDEQIYTYVLELVLGCRVDPVPLRLRRGGGVNEVRRKLPLLFQTIRHAGPQRDTYFVVGIDNDRASEHPGHPQNSHGRAEACRECALDAA